MNNEPVAWMYEKPSGASKLSFVQEKMLWDDMKETPLYIHPADLTDEEIDEAWKSVDHTIEYSKYRIEISKAILRKAQGD